MEQASFDLLFAVVVVLFVVPISLCHVYFNRRRAKQRGSEIEEAKIDEPDGGDTGDSGRRRTSLLRPRSRTRKRTLPPALGGGRSKDDVMRACAASPAATSAETSSTSALAAPELMDGSGRAASL